LLWSKTVRTLCSVVSLTIFNRTNGTNFISLISKSNFKVYKLPEVMKFGCLQQKYDF
jgi:hypothetical protein